MVKSRLMDDFSVSNIVKVKGYTSVWTLGITQTWALEK